MEMLVIHLNSYLLKYFNDIFQDFVIFKFLIPKFTVVLKQIRKLCFILRKWMQNKSNSMNLKKKCFKIEKREY